MKIPICWHVSVCYILSSMITLAFMEDDIKFYAKKACSISASDLVYLVWVQQCIYPLI